MRYIRKWLGDRNDSTLRYIPLAWILFLALNGWEDIADGLDIWEIISLPFALLILAAFVGLLVHAPTDAQERGTSNGKLLLWEIIALAAFTAFLCGCGIL